MRVDGDEQRAAQIDQAMTPLTAAEVAEDVVWVASRPSRVNADHLLVLPRDRAVATRVHRGED